MAVTEKVLLTTSEIATMFGLTDCYLRKLRQLQAGPTYSKIGKLVRYRRADVEKWLETAAVEVLPKRAM